MTQQPKRICILGGGFGGLYTALRLSELPWTAEEKPEIVLIDKGDRFLFSPLLYELITGELNSWEIAPTFEELLADTPIQFCQTVVTGVDIDAKQIQLEEQPSLSYDILVLALGGKTPTETVPGAKQYTIPFRTLADAQRLEARLRELEQSDTEKIRVAVVGGGYSGVELACKVSDRLGKRGRLRLIQRSDDILPTASDFNRETAKKALQDRKVWLDLETTVKSVGENSLSLEYQGQVDTLTAEIILWTVGNQVSELIQALPLKQNQQGLLVIQPTLQVPDHEEIFALGDIVDCYDATGTSVPATAQSAFQQSDYCAWNIWATLTSRPLLPFRYQHLGEMMTLGKDSATLSGLGLKFEGSLAYLARRLIYLYRLPTLKHQLTVGLNWIAQPMLELLANFE